MPEDEHNEFKARAQADKARKLAREIYRQMLECTLRLTEEDWRAVAQAAGTTDPSPTTQALVLEILKGKEPHANLHQS